MTTEEDSRKMKKESPAKLGRPSSRANLLDCAMELILERGVEGLSFDSLSQKSGISKGGVLYHFPNREALNRAVRLHVRQRYLAARREMTDDLPEGKTRALKGWALASLQNRSNLDAVSAKLMTSGLWVASEGREHHRERLTTVVNAGASFNRAALVYLAVEGLWFLDLAGFTPFTPEERQQVIDMLLSIIDDPAFDHLDG